MRLDTYNLRARLFPAILGVAPAIALVTIAISWSSLSFPQAIATAAICVLFVAFADIARRFGKRIEEKLYLASGGKPSVRLLRHADTAFDQETKTRYKNFLAQKIKSEPPSEEDERTNPAAADAYYERCGNWLRENTRDTSRFYILLEENITYGFRRNLYGLKWPGLTLNCLVVLLCAYMIYKGENLTGNAATQSQIYSVLAIAAVHAMYFLFFVTRRAVSEAADQYGRQLILSSEQLMAD